MKKIFVAAACAVSLSGAAQAAVVTINFEAANLNGDGLSLLGLSAGDSLTGSFTYDDALPDNRVSFANSRYSYDYGRDNSSSMSVSIAGTTYVGSSADFVVSRDGISNGTSTIGDRFTSYMYDMFNAVPGIWDSAGWVQVSDNDVNSWSGLAPTAAELNAARSRHFQLNLYPDSSRVYFVRSSSVTFSNPDVSDLTPVPLPAGGALLLAGLGALAFLRRRKA